jgi:hypothetical protein
LASWWRAWAEQVRLGLLHGGGVEGVGELVDPPEDDPGLLGQHLAGGERVAGAGVCLELVSEPHGVVGGGPGGLRLVREPVGGRGGAGVGAEVEVVGVRGDAGLELDQPGLGALERDQRPGGLLGVHRPDRGVDDGVELGVDVRGRDTDPVAGCGDRCHGSTQALTTDSRRPRTLVSTGF